MALCLSHREEIVKFCYILTKYMMNSALQILIFKNFPHVNIVENDEVFKGQKQDGFLT